MASENLRREGFNEIHEIKSSSNTGIDRIAIKRGPEGSIKDVRFVEVKSGRSAATKLGDTRFGGKQLSPKWINENLRKLRTSSDGQLRQMAVDLRRFRRATGRPVEAFALLMQIDTKRGMIRKLASDGRTLVSAERMETVLRDLRKNGSPSSRRWAGRSLSAEGKIRSTSMSNWLDETRRKKRLALFAHQRKAVARAKLSQPHSLAHTRKMLRRAFGRAVWILVLIEASHEAYQTERAFRNGSISLRERNTRLVVALGGVAGGIAGGAAGGAAGAWTGAAVGTLGGPFAWITVPAGALIGGAVGGAIGGAAGYYGGSAIAQLGADAWYDSIDASVKQQFEEEWMAAIYPGS